MNVKLIPLFQINTTQSTATTTTTATTKTKKNTKISTCFIALKTIKCGGIFNQEMIESFRDKARRLGSWLLQHACGVWVYNVRLASYQDGDHHVYAIRIRHLLIIILDLWTEPDLRKKHKNKFSFNFLMTKMNCGMLFRYRLHICGPNLTKDFLSLSLSLSLNRSLCATEFQPRYLGQILKESIDQSLCFLFRHLGRKIIKQTKNKHNQQFNSGSQKKEGPDPGPGPGPGVASLVFPQWWLR